MVFQIRDMEIESECLLIKGLISEGKNRLYATRGVGQVVLFLYDLVNVKNIAMSVNDLGGTRDIFINVCK